MVVVEDQQLLGAADRSPDVQIRHRRSLTRSPCLADAMSPPPVGPPFTRQRVWFRCASGKPTFTRTQRASIGKRHRGGHDNGTLIGFRIPGWPRCGSGVNRPDPVAARRHAVGGHPTCCSAAPGHPGRSTANRSGGRPLSPASGHALDRVASPRPGETKLNRWVQQGSSRVSLTASARSRDAPQMGQGQLETRTPAAPRRGFRRGPDGDGLRPVALQRLAAAVGRRGHGTTGGAVDEQAGRTEAVQLFHGRDRDHLVDVDGAPNKLSADPDRNAQE